MLLNDTPNGKPLKQQAVDTSYPFSSSNKPTVSVVIPTLNEAKNLPYVLPRIPDIVDEVVLVDGRSTDNTIEVARRLRPDIRIILEKRRGKGVALRTGFKAATGDIIIMLDADGSMYPEEIYTFVGALMAGADFAKGSRFLQGGGTSDMEFYRKFGNWCFVMLVRVLFGGKYSDLCYGYNAFWAYTLPLLELDGDGFEIETMMNVRAVHAGLSITEVPSFEAQRIHGYSKLQTIPDGWQVLKTIFKEWLGKPRLRAVPKVERARDDSFVPAVRLLFREAIHLARNQKDLPSQAYESNRQAVKLAYSMLLSLETTCPNAKMLQERYSQYYNDESIWAFLESSESMVE